jgi:hypothetical protein
VSKKISLRCHFHYSEFVINHLPAALWIVPGVGGRVEKTLQQGEDNPHRRVNKFPPFYSTLEGSVYPAMRAIKCATASAAQPKLAI